ncbi:hypothetical protein D3C79_595310 [compost metagenome]
MRYGAAVDGDEGTLFSEGTVMQLPRHQLLASPAGPRHQYRQTAMLQTHDLIPQVADRCAFSLNKAQLNRQLGTVTSDELGHAQRMSKAMGEPVLIEWESVKIMEAGSEQIAQCLTGKAITLDQGNPQAAGVLRNQGVQCLMLIRPDGHQHQGIVPFLQFFFCHCQGTRQLDSPLPFYQQTFQHGT